MGKFVLFAVIIWLLWNKMGSFRTQWRIIIPAVLGVVIGLAHAGFVQQLGVTGEFQKVGISPGLITLGLIVAWALFVIARAKPFLERLFPPERSRRDEHRRPRN